ncbi:MAG: stage III sporulation protein AE [Clostridia bacterium]|nr:stage III sporulation protein AE [Clostridia bacterium]
MKKIIIILLFALIVINPVISIATENDEILNQQKESIDIPKFIEEAQKYTSSVFEDTDMQELLNSAIAGNIDNSKLLHGILSIIGKETLSSVKTIASIMVVIIIHSILKSITDNLENKSVGQIAYYVQYILIVTIIMSSFAEVITMVKDSVQNLVTFSNLLIPILITLVVTTGNLVTANTIQPILLFLVTFIGNFVSNIVLPVVLASTVLSIVSKISEKVQLEKLSKFMKSSAVWILSIILTLFVSLLSVEGSLSSNVDGITKRTAKAAVSTVIPVVGKILSDSIDSVIGCASILKNGVGIVGVVTIIAVCIVPIIKLLVLMTMYYIGAAVCEPLADKKIIDLLQQMGDTFKIMLAILCVLSVMLIIGTTLVMKISNTGMA